MNASEKLFAFLSKKLCINVPQISSSSDYSLIQTRNIFNTFNMIKLCNLFFICNKRPQFFLIFYRSCLIMEYETQNGIRIWNHSKDYAESGYCCQKLVQDLANRCKSYDTEYPECIPLEIKNIDQFMDYIIV